MRRASDSADFRPPDVPRPSVLSGVAVDRNGNWSQLFIVHRVVYHWVSGQMLVNGTKIADCRNCCLTRKGDIVAMLSALPSMV